MLTITFVIDARPDAGLGHLQRCFAIAKALVSEDPITVVELLLLDAPEPAPLPPPAGTRSLKAITRNVLNDPDSLRSSGNESRILILDSYFLNEAGWLHKLRKSYPLTPVLCFDDNEVGNEWPVMGLIRPSIGATAKGLNSTMLGFSAIGPGFVPLRAEIVIAGENAALLTTKSHTPNILVTLGGADPEFYTERVVRTLAAIKLRSTFNIVFGPGADKSRLALLVPDGRFKLHHSPDNFLELMQKADLAITGGGGTCHELLFLGTPVAAIALANNQMSICRAVNDLGCGYFIGEMGKLSDRELKERIAVRLLNPDNFAEMPAIGRNLIDGGGAMRLARHILAVLHSFYRDKFNITDVATEYDESATQPDEHAKVRWGSDASMRNRMHLARSRINWSKADRWLDIGAGTGLFLELAEEYGSPSEFFGIDLSEKMLECARAKKYKTVQTTFLQKNFMEELPDEPFSLVTALGVLQKCGVPLALALRRIGELATPGGEIFLTTKNATWRQFEDSQSTPFTGHHWFGPEQLLHNCRNAGLRVMEIGSFDPASNSVSDNLRKHHSLFILARKEL